MVVGRVTVALGFVVGVRTEVAVSAAVASVVDRIDVSVVVVNVTG